MFRKMLAVMVVAAIAAGAGLFGTDPVAVEASPSATRSFSPARVSPGEQVTVTISADNYGSGGTVIERLPQRFGWVSTSLDPQRVNAVPREVTFTLQGETSFTYTVTAPSNAGSHTFSGTLRDSNGNRHTVGGATTVTVYSVDPLVARYDTNGTPGIQRSEVIKAINDYLSDGGNVITRADVIKLINLYLSGPGDVRPPGAPTNLTARANGQTRINLSWRTPASNGGAAITGYRIEVSTNGSSWSNRVANTNSTDTRYSHTGLTAGSARHYRVSAINSAGTGAVSNVATATTDSASGGGSPDLVVQRPTVSDSSPGAGESFTLTTTVRNQGSGDSGPTILRYYLSSDSTINTGDTQVGDNQVMSLAASGSISESVDLTAPGGVGTYHYGACVDPVSGESDTGNNCSDSMPVTVEEFPDLVVGPVEVSENSLDAEEPFTLTTLVRNQGTGPSASTTLRYYRSTDSTISPSDTEVGDDQVVVLGASGSIRESIGLTALSKAGTYYYGACVDPVSGESDTGNNCTGGAAVTVVERPDLVVQSPMVSDPSPDAGARFTLSVTVRNLGIGESASTTLRYYRSTDLTITGSDTEVDDTHVQAIAARKSLLRSKELEAPDNAGIYYYGACVDSVLNESDTDNNCSDAVTVTVP